MYLSVASWKTSVLRRMIASTVWLVCFSFLREWHFDLLELFPNIWNIPPFQKIYYLYIQTVTSNSLHNSSYSLPLQVSATGYGHFQEAANLIEKYRYSIHCKQLHVNGKKYLLVSLYIYIKIGVSYNYIKIGVSLH